MIKISFWMQKILCIWVATYNSLFGPTKHIYICVCIYTCVYIYVCVCVCGEAILYFWLCYTADRSYSIAHIVLREFIQQPKSIQCQNGTTPHWLTNCCTCIYWFNLYIYAAGRKIRFQNIVYAQSQLLVRYARIIDKTTS